MRRGTRRIWLSGIGLLLLLAATTGLAFVPLGSFNFVISLAIAAAKSLIILMIFMDLVAASQLTRIFAVCRIFLARHPARIARRGLSRAEQQRDSRYRRTVIDAPGDLQAFRRFPNAPKTAPAINAAMPQHTIRCRLASICGLVSLARPSKRPCAA